MVQHKDCVCVLCLRIEFRINQWLHTWLVLRRHKEGVGSGKQWWERSVPMWKKEIILIFYTILKYQLMPGRADWLERPRWGEYEFKTYLGCSSVAECLPSTEVQGSTSSTAWMKPVFLAWQIMPLTCLRIEHRLLTISLYLEKCQLAFFVHCLVCHCNGWKMLCGLFLGTVEIELSLPPSPSPHVPGTFQSDSQ